MAKYDYEFKKKVVEAYFQGHGGYRQIALQFSISSGHGVVRRWVKQVTALGFVSLRKQERRSDYTIQFKLDVINYYLNSGESIRDVAHKFNLPNDSMVSLWTTAFRKHGIGGISPKTQGRPSMSDKPKKTKEEKKLSREQELERENELLRAELAFITYQMRQYANLLKNNKIFQSMSRKGNCLDNSPMENFFGLLKQEIYYGTIYTSFEEIKQAIDKYIYYYNYKLIKSKFGCSPVTYRVRLAA